MLPVLLCFLAPVVVRHWTASWITAPNSPEQGYGVYHFRRSFDLPQAPHEFVIRVSADNRYQLYVNGARVRSGPERGDLTHWRYDTLDIAGSLHAGSNVIAAVVWNDGPKRAVAQISNQTGFLLDGPEIGSNSAWKCIADPAYSVRVPPPGEQTGYYALGPNEHFDASQYPWGWEQPAYDDSSWQPAKIISRAADRDSQDAPNRWMLVENTLPAQEESPEKPLQSRAGGSLPLQAPASSKVTLLLDQGHLTTAYPELHVTGGRGASINIRYAETLYDNTHPLTKSNRNDVAGKIFIGPADTYLPDGGDRIYRPLYWRAYRYIQLEIQTGAEPVSILSLTGTFTAYPFERRAEFRADDEIERIIDTGWHTARLCAHETYMDCPFYEQLQYAGDARIQMLVSIYMTGDTRLMKNGIALLNSSRTAEGATYSRAPSALQQYIPPFSLWWIGMVHDYWYYVDDPDFVHDMLPGVEAVLSFFARYQQPNGSLGHLPWWNFVDWVHSWKDGVPPRGPDGSSAALDLQLLLAYQWAADLENGFGNKAASAQYAGMSQQLATAIRQLYWDSQRGLFADQPAHETYSQQVNTLAILAHIVPKADLHLVIEKIFSDKSLAPSSVYFLAYTNAALREAGEGGSYMDHLQPWRHMLEQGLTTWSEWDAPDTRSDCHAWGASPNFELLRTVAGIDSAAPGFKRIRIQPNFGSLQRIQASMPHPAGAIEVNLTRSGDHVDGSITLPSGTTGTFVWSGNVQQLRSGANHISR